MTEKEEYQYLDLISNILEKGSLQTGRNGDTKSIFGSTMRFSLENNKIPFLTTKKLAWKICLKELLWFIRGKTDNNLLNNEGVRIWDANGSREFLEFGKFENMTYLQLIKSGKYIHKNYIQWILSENFMNELVKEKLKTFIQNRHNYRS
jgi:thymidylate synthase